MNLQRSYELDLAAEQVGEEIKRTIKQRPPYQYQPQDAAL
jgi:hypothetical protein